jgi:hypothetical protein
MSVPFNAARDWHYYRITITGPGDITTTEEGQAQLATILADIDTALEVTTATIPPPDKVTVEVQPLPF